MRPIEFEILLTLASGASHGYAIIQEIEARGSGHPRVETATLYRALQRLTEQGLVEPAASPHPADADDPRRRYHAITAAGRRAAADESWRLARLVEGARAARLLPGPG